MKIKKLIKGTPIQIKGSKEIEITGVCGNSKLVAPGNLFVARQGKVYDGTQYIPEAIAAGASAVLTDIYDPTLKDITQLIHPNIREMEALMAARYYEFPGDQLFMVGITGTNGKTTTSFLMKHLIDQIFGLCGLIGTIEYVIGQHRYQATRTAPDVATNHKLLREMLMQDCKAAIMEVTSHALDQGRVEHIDYDVAIFTNLTVDHLDYHQSMENYFLAKKKLFTNLSNDTGRRAKQYPKMAVINVDSPWASRLLEECKVNTLTYAIESNADLRATDIKMTGNGTEFILHYHGQCIPCRSPLIGRYNVYNVLAAIGAILCRKVPLQKIVPLIATFSSVPGRLEPVPNPLGLNIYVDFAHSDDALSNVLECLRELKPKKLITIFGCGGDRDQTKRPKMARACEEGADFCIVTSDNPRSEDPQTIAKQVIQGFQMQNYVVEIDRFNAIQRAIETATKDDIILIAGKGHEPYQIFSHKIIEFDDRKVALQICQNVHRLQKCK
jgi:UDP-N-acetylmuramoyl-L-alanyl-D-glutamate--2,6-diaminopimelate ligase